VLKNTSLVTLLCLAILVVFSLTMPLSGSFAYNLYRVALVEYLQELSTGGEKPLHPDVNEWLVRSASWGNRQASEELNYLRQARTLPGAELDPLLFWLSIYRWQEERVGRPSSDVSWYLARDGRVRIEAESMWIGGAATPNPFVATRREESSGYVNLYWPNNYLYSRLVVPVTGTYRVAVRAIDWPPMPLRLRVDIDEESHELLWDVGDHKWREQEFTLHLARGMTVLRITYLTPLGNRTQNASIDYLELQRVD
jgi:hypothetical protein